MDQLNQPSALPLRPVLVDATVLASWMGLAPLPDDGAAKEGFAPPEQVPEAGSLTLLDVRWSAMNPGEGHEQYRRGHLPGAVFVSMSGQLSGHGAPSAGRHPLPDPGRFGESVRMLGINDGDTVVVYDDVNSASAPRAWWLLRHAGIERVFVLDGGLSAWRSAGLPLQPGEVLPVTGTAHTSWGKMPVVDTESVSELIQKGVVLDARSAERYRGDHEPLDPVAGHIPGAHSVPISELFTAEGTFKTPDQLRELFQRQGIDSHTPVGAYCGSGVSAAAEVLALNLIGINAALYPGSWSAWCNTPGHTVETGDAGLPKESV